MRLVNVFWLKSKITIVFDKTSIEMEKWAILWMRGGICRIFVTNNDYLRISIGWFNISSLLNASSSLMPKNRVLYCK